MSDIILGAEATAVSHTEKPCPRGTHTLVEKRGVEQSEIFFRK